MQTLIDQFASTIRTAAENQRPLHIQGGGSKAFYGRPLINPAEKLDVSALQGIIDYEPTELVITARAGTTLATIESLLQQNNQMLAFEPPYFANSATLGGCIATGLSGPRRASAGAVRDFVLGVRILDGNGRDLRFGGQVMKNVAGYDVSRLMVGAMGTLGVLLEISLKVLPIPAVERTLSLDMDEAHAIEYMNRWAGKPLPISATGFVDDRLFIRLSGAESAVHAAQIQLGGEINQESEMFWKSVREHSHNFFKSAKSLWRLSVKSTTPPIKLPQSTQFIEWNGALRWLAYQETMPADIIRQITREIGGSATFFRNTDPAIPVFQQPGPALMHVHRQLKKQFDPAGILNPGRLYPQF